MVAWWSSAEQTITSYLKTNKSN